MSLTHHVLERFPERRSAIAGLLERNAEFGSLCEDYGEAVEALRRWQASPDDNASLEVRHFGLLVTELEEEILSALAEASDHNRTQR